MECNKEEAIRAKQIAEVRLHNNDFIGALRFAQKAQRLFPDLDNISQLLAVCEVHSSAQTKVFGSEFDWYGILQIEKKPSDDITVNKQYRKLALLLHPDKNNLPGAEAAFKLIGEAKRVLTDQAQRKLYDMKVRNSVAFQKPPAHQPTQKPGARKHNGTKNKSGTTLNSQCPSSNTNQQGQQQTFWTCCPSCNVRYQYYKHFVNKALRCQTCKKPFIAYDLSTQGMAPGSRWNQYVNRQEFSDAGSSNVSSQIHGGVPSNMEFKDRFVGLDQMFKQKGYSVGGGSSKTEGAHNGFVYKGAEKKEDRRPDSYAGRLREVDPASSLGRKRGRKSGLECGRTFEHVSNDDTPKDAGTPGNGISPSQPNVECDQTPRRSSRLKQNVSHSGTPADEADFVSTPKRLRVNGYADAAEAKKNRGTVEGSCNEDDSACPISEEGSRNVKDPFHKASFVGKNIGNVESKEKRVESASTNQEPQVVVCLDPEFSDFEKDKEQGRFGVNQIWACYDKLDGMPRYYARIKKVSHREFKVQFVWLEADPDNQFEIDWCDKELPVACGKYKSGGTEETMDNLMFSHQMQSTKVGRRGVYLIYPRKGEIWALFKNWDVKWSARPKKYLSFKYDYVEVLSNYVEGSGIKVVCLSKVKGFVCLFQRVDVHKDVDASFEIPPHELYRFSHQIPSFVMTGKEREGVPAGSFELDPAAVDLSNSAAVDISGPTFVENKRMNDEMGNKFFSHVEPVTLSVPCNQEDSSEPQTRKIVLGLTSLTTLARSSRKQGMPHKSHFHVIRAKSNKEVVLEQAVSQEGRSQNLSPKVHTSRKHELKNKGETSDIRRSPRV